MTITEFLEARIAEDERANDLDVDPESWCDRVAGTHYGHDRIAAECAAKRALVVETSKWGHRYNDDDMWYSCGLATSWDDDEPGSGCSDESARGRCSCGLEQRVLRILVPLAAIYADHADYRQEWAC